MTFKFITHAVSHNLSVGHYIWQDCKTNNYFISPEGRNYKIINNSNQQFMLNYFPKSETIYDNYKSNLYECIQLSDINVSTGSVFYNSSFWTFKI